MRGMRRDRVLLWDDIIDLLLGLVTRQNKTSQKRIEARVEIELMGCFETGERDD